MAESLLDFALNVNIMDSDDEQPVFNNKDLEQEEQEYKNWEDSFGHSSVVPLGLRRSDYVLKDMAMELEESDEDEEEEMGQDYEDDIDETSQDHPMHINDDEEPFL